MEVSSTHPPTYAPSWGGKRGGEREGRTVPVEVSSTHPPTYLPIQASLYTTARKEERSVSKRRRRQGETNPHLPSSHPPTHPPTPSNPGEVTKYLVYNMRKRQEGTSLPSIHPPTHLPTPPPPL